MKKIITLILLTYSITSRGQSEKIFYRDVVQSCIVEKRELIKQAYENKENKKAKALRTDIINTCLKGKYLSNYEFKTIKKKKISTDKIDKPFVIFTSATWCGPCWGEIPTVNKLAEIYKNEVEFIVLFSNQKNELKKMSKQYSKLIHLIPSPIKQIGHDNIFINGFEHRLDFPGAYLIDENKKIIDYTVGAAYPTKKMGWTEVNRINEEKLLKFLKPILK